MGRPPLDIGTYGKIKATRVGDTWVARTLYRDIDAVTRPVKRADTTEAKAIRRLKKALAERSHRDGELTRESTFAEAGERWLAEVDRRRRGTTYDRYRPRLRNQVLPALGKLRLRECTVTRCDAYFAELERRLSSNTVRGYRTVVSGVLGYAVRVGALDHNPVDGTLPIEGKGKPSRALTRAERDDLLAKVDADRRAGEDDLPDVFRYLLGTGVRLGEVMGLRWFRVDLDEGVVVHGDNLVREIRRCVACGRGHREHARQGKLRTTCPDGAGTWTDPDTPGLALREPKTLAGFRVLPLPDFVLLMLRLRYPGERYALGPVFPNSLGGWRDPNNTGRSVRKFREAAGYPWLTPHVFRHTAASVLDDQGLSARKISNYLGHANPAMTQSVYMSRQVQAAGAAAGLDAAMRPARS